MKLFGLKYLINRTVSYFFFLAYGHCEKITETLKVLWNCDKYCQKIIFIQESFSFFYICTMDHIVELYF